MPAWIEVDAPRSLGRTLSAFRAGPGDPTTALRPGRFLRAALTPDGPGTLLLRWGRDPALAGSDGLRADAWGPGAAWLLDRVDALTGTADRPIAWPGAHPAVAAALRDARTRRLGASGDPYHQLLPTILAQRITAGEALRQWARLVRRLGDPAPGPPDVVGDLRLPPAPAAIRRPSWWFHPLGIEEKRARTLGEVARHAARLWEWAEAGPAVLTARLAAIPGVGPWTTGSVVGPVCGDPDTVVVGDYHFANSVGWALVRRARSTDDEMLDLLAPYAGQRGRVLAAVVATNPHAPAFGPRRRILPMHAW